MVKWGPGNFYDGKTSARQSVTVELDPTMLNIRADQGHLFVRWPYTELEMLPAPDGMRRLAKAGNAVLARLDIRDTALIAALDERALSAGAAGANQRRGRRKVVAWSIAATVSLVLVGAFGVPVLADLAAPLVPRLAESRLGEAVDAQVRKMLEPGSNGKSVECGLAASEKDGRAALDRLMARLEGVTALPVPLQVTVVRRSQPNAFAIPGGRIYVFEGLIDKAETADELAGVIAHEIGHVAHRDGTRSVLQSAGLSFLFGLVLGDFVGGGALVIAARSILGSAYSREVESNADAFGVDLMNRIGRDGRGLGVILDRIAGAIEPGVQALADHPETRARVVAIGQVASGGSGAALLDGPEWTALKQICAGR